MGRPRLKLNIRRVYLRVAGRMSPPQIVAISFVLLILTGTGLLLLPFSQRPGTDISVTDALFASTSAVCVNGLVTHSTAETWTFFGKAVFLVLFQIGGLSLVAVYTYFLVQLGRKVTLRDRLTVQSAFNVADMSGVVRMVLLVIRGTLIFEAAGALLLFPSFLARGYSWYNSIFYGIFHSVSAFCNAGFDLLGPEGVIPFVKSPLPSIVLMLLITAGGIGFTVWRDLLTKLRSFIRPDVRKRGRLSVHSKLALITSAALALGGALFFFAAEYKNPETLGPLSVPGKALAALFQSVSLRSAGFAAVSEAGLREGSKLVSSLFVLIGGSPGGTAGGLKTVTVAVILCGARSILTGRESINVFGRSIPPSAFKKAVGITVLILTLWISSSALLAVTESASAFDHSAADILLETASALGSAGFSTGMTPYLSVAGRVIIILCMFLGRIGLLALALSIAERGNRGRERIIFPETDIMIG